MTWARDPFQRAPEFIGRMREPLRIALAVTLPIGIVSSALVLIRLFRPNLGAAESVLCVCVAFMGLSLALAIALMAGHHFAASAAYAVVHAVGMLALNASMVSILAFAEMVLMAVLNGMFTDVALGAVLTIGMLIGTVLMFALATAVFSEIGSRTYDFPAPDIRIPLMLGTGIAVAGISHLHQMSALAAAAIALTAAAAIVSHGRPRSS